MRITKLEYQKDDPSRVSVFIDGKFAVGLNTNDVLTLKIYQNKEITPEEFTALLSVSELGRLFNDALSFLSFRPRSEWEIRNHLSKKNQVAKAKGKGKEDGALNAYIDQIIDKLTAMGQVNDKAFTEWFLDQRQSFKPKGKRALVFELSQKGVARRIVEEVLEDRETLGTAVSELSQATILAEKKFGGKLLVEQKAKLARFLSSRGYGWDVISEVIAKLAKKE